MELRLSPGGRRYGYKKDAADHRDPVWHLATTLWPPWVDREKAVFAMLTLAFDAGGDAGTDYLTVAGFGNYPL
jgi:hypothetical protein